MQPMKVRSVPPGELGPRPSKVGVADPGRPTLGQYAAQGALNEGSDAWACPRCGCRDWRVSDSHLRSGQRRRLRKCRNCGEPLRTLEIPAPDGFTVQIVPEEDVA